MSLGIGFMQVSSVNTQRRYELDWLRVILIFTVFLHHVFMPFNGDDWHIMNAESSKVLDDIMVYFEQFRLPILFLISGAASTILLAKKAKFVYFKERMSRLLIPLLVGIILIVPPQTYFENISQYDSYIKAFPSLAMQFEVNHLWFIEYLVVFVVLAIPLTLIIRSRAGATLVSVLDKLSQKSYGLFLLVIPLLLIRIISKRYFPEDSGGIENLSRSLYYLYFFIAGMLLIYRDSIWQAFKKHRKLNLNILFVSSVVFYAYYYSDLSAYLSLNTRWSIWWGVAILVSWSAALAIIGYAQEYLTKTSAWLVKTNEMIYPFYIFHQTVIVIFAYYIVQWQLGIGIKILALLFSSLIVIIILLLIVSRLNIIRPFFGLKRKN